MAARLIPKESSPMRASPLSLSRMRLYFAVADISACPDRTYLSSYLGGKIAGFPLNALSDYVEDKARYRSARALEQGFHGLLSCRILDEDLTEQRCFFQKLLHAAFDHLLDNIGRFARFSRFSGGDVAFLLHELRRNIIARQAERSGRRDVHGEIPAELVAAVGNIHQDADLRPAVNVLRQAALGFDSGKSA